jgi:hypothetical protein
MPPPPRPGQTGDFVTITHRGDDARRGTGSLDRSIKQGGARPGDIDIMTRIILVFGSIAGSLVALFLILGMTLLAGSDGVGSEAIGYLGMLLSLSIIFVAIKRHRDINLGGVFYVVAWEIYFNATDRAFMEAYLSGQIAAREAAGATAAELAAFRDEMTAMMEMYGNWWFRLPMTFIEIFPIGVLVSLISAALLRNRKLLPHRA